MPTAHKTHAEAGTQITRDNRTWNGQGNLDQAYVVTYGYRDTAPPYNDGTAKTDSNVQGTFSQFSAQQIARAELALNLWEDVANITFNRVMGDKGSPYTDDATMLFANYSSQFDGSGAFAYAPGATKGFATPDTGKAVQDGDFWNNVAHPTNKTAFEGSYGFQTMLHEIGHALGLRHPGDYNAAPGVTLTYAKNAEYVEDSRQYTVMSYFQASETKADHGGIYGYTPLVDDIMAMQRLYGVRMTTRTEDTTYGFNSKADRDVFHIDVANEKAVFAIWDAGGNDTLDFSGYKQDGTIDLGPGKFSSVGGLKNNIAVAEDPTNEPLVAAPDFFLIENAIGGKGNDTIEGNKADNYLGGGDGNDVLNGYEGKDVLLGGKGTNTISGGDGGDVGAFNHSRLFYDHDKLADGVHKFTGAGFAAGEITTTDQTVEDHLFNVERVNGELVAKITPGITKNFVSLSKNAKHLTMQDDSPSAFVDLSSAFLGGLDFYGKHYEGLWVNNNGNVTFGSALSAFTPGVIGGGSSTAIIAPFWADVDTRLKTGGGQADFAHGKVSYDVDADKGTLIVQWDNVGYFSSTGKNYIHKINDFQLQLIDQGSGDFEIIFRYAAINWTTGGASGGKDGLGGTIARAGFSSGTGASGAYFELEYSGKQDDMLNLENIQGNAKTAGVWQFRITDGKVEGIGNDTNETLEGNDNPNFIDGGKGNDLINGKGGGDTLNGGVGDDVLNGDDGKDNLDGGVGDDVLDGGVGDDLMDGGTGDDTFIVDNKLDIIVERPGAGLDLIICLIDYTMPNGKLVEVEDLELQGDAVKGTGNELDNNILGNTNNNILDGGAGNDTLDGGLGNDTLKGNLGDDTMLGAQGKDTMDGGLGFDIVQYNQPVVVLDMANPDAGAGDALGDIITSSVELVIGSGGDDQLLGGAGNDGFEGGDGNDVLNGRGGVNTLYYSRSGEGVTVSLDPVYGAPPEGGDATGDTISNFRNLVGSGANDVLTGIGFGFHPGAITGSGPDGINLLDGGEGNDKLDGGYNNDTLLGGGGDDFLNGGRHFVYPVPPFPINKTIPDNDVINGEDGIDTVTYEGSGSSLGITLELGKDGKMVMGKGSWDITGDKISNVENVIGSNRNDVITGNNLANELDGGALDDILAGGEGDVVDILDGGDGTDAVDYSDSAFGVTVTIGAAGAETIGKGGDANGDKLKNIEGAIGTDFNDTLIGNDDTNLFRAGKGDDFVQGGKGADRLDGGDGTDTLSYLNDVNGVSINLGKQMTVGANNIFNSGEPGGGTGEAQGDFLANFENALGGSGDDTLLGSKLNNVLAGGKGEDLLNGAEGNDTINGGEDADELIGGLGVDLVSYDTSANGVTVNLTNQGTSDKFGAPTGGDPPAQTGGDAVGDLLWGFENVTGSNKGDQITGDKGINTLNGFDGADTIIGGLGADVIIGGLGSDTMTGGEGLKANDKAVDKFVYTASADSLAVTGKYSAGTSDEIFDFFAGSDDLDFKGLDWSAKTGDQAFHIMAKGKTAVDAGGILITSTGSIALGFDNEILVDSNGDATVDMAIMVHSDKAMTAGDFLL